MSTSSRLLGGATRFARALREIPGTWRGSLQLRVVAATMAMSIVFALLLGWVLDSRIRDELLRTKIESSRAQTVSGLDTAQNWLKIGASQVKAANAQNGGQPG